MSGGEAGVWFGISVLEGRSLFVADGLDGVEIGGFLGGIPAEEAQTMKEITMAE